MSLWQIIRRLFPYVRQYRRLVVGTLLLTLIGALAAQVNPFVLRYTVNAVQRLHHQARSAGSRRDDGPRRAGRKPLARRFQPPQARWQLTGRPGGALRLGRALTDSFVFFSPQ